MRKLAIVFPACLLILQSQLFASDNFLFLNSYRESPDAFAMALQDHINENYEADNPSNTADLLKRFKECNPWKSLKRAETFVGEFRVCMDLYLFDLWGGVGKFDIQSSEGNGRSLVLTGTAPFVGGQIIFPYALNANILMEGKYWYFPSFATENSAVSNLRESSLVEGRLIYQRRISSTSFSLRAGLFSTKLPFVENANQGLLVSQSNLGLRSLVLAGPLLGLKFAYNRYQEIRHILYGDVMSTLYSDNLVFYRPRSSYIFHGGYKWFLSRRIAFMLDVELGRFYRKGEREVQTQLWGIGLQVFLF